MTRLVQFLAGLAVLVVLTPAVVRADDADVIDYRKHVMKTLGAQAAALGQILQQKIPPDNFAAHVHALHLASTQALKAFEPKVEGGDSKPDVWANWKDFSDKMTTMVKAMEELDTAAASGGMAAAAPKVQAALTCKGCHDVYRVKK